MNILNGVEKAEGEYIKVISPGDCFYDQQSLKEWVAHIEKNKVDLSFFNKDKYTIATEEVDLKEKKKYGEVCLSNINIKKLRRILLSVILRSFL